MMSAINNSPPTTGGIEDITTIFVVGFPDDMQEREFQNMFMFSNGFEAATLKIPMTTDIDDGQKKQIIGFAKFKSRNEAYEARDVISGRKVDSEKGCILKAEMAKKNLHTKRGLSSDAAIVGFTGPIGSMIPSRRGSIIQESLTGDGYYLDCPAPIPHDLLASADYPNDIGPYYDDPLMVHPVPTSLIDPPFTDRQLLNSPLESLSPSTTPLLEPSFDPSAMTERSMSAEQSRTSKVNLLPRPQSCTDRGFNSALFCSDTILSNRGAGLSISSSDSSLSSNSSSNNVTSPYLPAVLPNGAYRSMGDQNPPCNTLYVGNLPADTLEEELRVLFSRCPGYKRLCFRNRANGPMCFVEFEDVRCATQALIQLYGVPLSNSTKGGIRLSFSKNPLGVRQQPQQGGPGYTTYQMPNSQSATQPGQMPMMMEKENRLIHGH